MAKFSNIYNTQTIKIMDGLYHYSYDDPFELRAALDKCELFSFAQEFWQAIIARYPCDVYLNVLKKCEKLHTEGKPFAEAADLFAKNKQTLWLEYCAQSKKIENYNIVEFVSGFFRETCRSNPLCRPCVCKKTLLDFFESISRESHDSVKKNINNWISGHSKPNTREIYIQLCYALGLRVSRREATKLLDANHFLAFSCGQNPLYLRNAQEAVHYYCLMRPLGTECSANEEYDTAANYKYALSLIDALEEKQTVQSQNNGYTIESRQMIHNIKSESELIDFISNYTEENSTRYYSAGKMLKTFCEEYEILEHDEIGDENKKKKLTKGTSLQIIDIFTKVQTDRDSIKMLRDFVSKGYSLSDALYRSDIVSDMAEGRQIVSRDVFLLTALSLNYGTAYDVRSGRMRETHEFDECKSFHSFCNTVSAILESCNMAMLYPRRKFDFLVLYSYMSMTKDVNRNGIAHALSDYLLMTLELIDRTDRI